MTCSDAELRRKTKNTLIAALREGRHAPGDFKFTQRAQNSVQGMTGVPQLDLTLRDIAEYTGRETPPCCSYMLRFSSFLGIVTGLLTRTYRR